MPATVKRLVSAQFIPAGVTEIFTSSEKTQIVAASVANVGAATANFSLYIVPAGSIASGSTAVLFNKAVGGGRSYQIAEIIAQILEVGEGIHVSASASNTLTIRISGVEHTAET